MPIVRSSHAGSNCEVTMSFRQPIPFVDLTAITREVRDGIDVAIAHFLGAGHHPSHATRRRPTASNEHGLLRVAEQAAEGIGSLPMFPHMTEDQVSGVYTRLHELVAAEEASYVG
jgi:dTDP-4-amino-4,6-dideoxygalactose transaminase